MRSEGNVTIALICHQLLDRVGLLIMIGDKLKFMFRNEDFNVPILV